MIQLTDDGHLIIKDVQETCNDLGHLIAHCENNDYAPSDIQKLIEIQSELALQIYYESEPSETLQQNNESIIAHSQIPFPTFEDGQYLISGDE